MPENRPDNAISSPPAALPTMAPTAPSKRKHRPGLARVQIACERCRTRKNKCDGNLPICSTCKRAGVPCIIVDRITQRHQPRGHVEELEAENARLKERIRQLEQEISTNQPEQGSFGTPDQMQQDDSLTASLDIIEQASPFNTTSKDASREDSGSLSTSQAAATTTSSSHSAIGSVIQAVLLKPDYGEAENSAQNDYRPPAGGCAPGVLNSTPNSLEARRLPLPSTELAQQLQNAYFTHRWPALPLLHRPLFLGQHYDAVMDPGREAGDVSTFLTLMVFSLGALDLKRQDVSFSDDHLEYFAVAMQHHLTGLINSGAIEAVQGLLLMAVYAVNESQSVNSWQCVGQAVRLAIDLGLHQSPSSTDSDLLTIEMRRRVFWCAYTLDRNISVTLGKPCAIQDIDINVALPQEYTDDELLMAMPGSATSLSRQPHPLDMSTFIHTIKLRQIQSRIKDTFYSGGAYHHVSKENILWSRQSLREELDSWVATAPRYSKPTEATFQTPDWFRIAYSHGLLLLYRPSPASPIVELEGLQICADSAITLISSYSSLYAKNKITYTWIALHSLFMASVTMLYTLWVSPEIRKSTRKTIVKSNVMSCLALFDVMSDHWSLALRCHKIIDRLGVAAIALFDPSAAVESPTVTGGSSDQYHFGQIDAEYREWFGTRDSSRLPLSSLNVDSFELDQTSGTGATQINDDSSMLLLNETDFFPGLDEWADQGFDITIPIMTNAFVNEPYMNAVTEQEKM